jgi:hypothetical protein
MHIINMDRIMRCNSITFYERGITMPRTKKIAEAETAIETTTAETSTKKTTTKKKTAKGDAEALYVENYHIKMWFIQPLLGSAPGDPDLYKRFIASNAPDAPTREEELTSNTVENVAARGVNVFVRRTKTGLPAVGQHTIKGFFKESMTASRRQEGSVSKGIANHKTRIVGNVVIKPTWINIQIPEDQIKDCTEEQFMKEGYGRYAAVRFPKEGRFQQYKLPTLDRPLQAETAKGKITSIASSEMAPAGTIIEYDMKIETKDLSAGIIDVILRGNEHGTGQWRGSGEYGAFVTEIYDENGEIVANNTESTIGCTSKDPEFIDKLYEYIDENNL